MSPVTKKSKSLKKIPKVVKQDTTTFSVKKKVGKSFKVEVPDKMIDELKNEHMKGVITVGGGARDKIRKYLMKKYGGSMTKNKYVLKALNLIDEHAGNLAQKEKEKMPKMDRVAAVVIGKEVILIDLPIKDSEKINKKYKKDPDGATEDLKSILAYHGYPANEVVVNAVLDDITRRLVPVKIKGKEVYIPYSKGNRLVLANESKYKPEIKTAKKEVGEYLEMAGYKLTKNELEDVYKKIIVNEDKFEGVEPLIVMDIEGNNHSMGIITAVQYAEKDAKMAIGFVQKTLNDAKKSEAYTKKAEYYLEKAIHAYAAGSYTHARNLAIKAVQSIIVSKVEE